MGKIKLSLMRFLVSKSGSLLTPIIAGFVATLVAKVAVFDASLAGQLDQTAIAGFIVAAILTAVNYATNSVQTSGIKKIQALVNADQDGIPGPITYTEVRRAIPVAQLQRLRSRPSLRPRQSAQLTVVLSGSACLPPCASTSSRARAWRSRSLTSGSRQRPISSRARFFTECGSRAGSAQSLTGQIEASAKRSWG